MSTTPTSTSLGLRDAQLGIVLTRNNATSWFRRVESLIRSKRCWEAVTVTTATTRIGLPRIVLASAGLFNEDQFKFKDLDALPED